MAEQRHDNEHDADRPDPNVDPAATESIPLKGIPAEMSLIREWAVHITVPIWLVDADGNLVYYNEPAEGLLGRRFDSSGGIPGVELVALFDITTPEGDPLSDEELPIALALHGRRPVHRRLRIVALDRRPRLIEVSALPLLRHDGAFLGAVALFWEREQAV